MIDIDDNYEPLPVRGWFLTGLGVLITWNALAIYGLIHLVRSL
jgi:hypothetical protein